MKLATTAEIKNATESVFIPAGIVIADSTEAAILIPSDTPSTFTQKSKDMRIRKSIVNEIAPTNKNFINWRTIFRSQSGSLAASTAEANANNYADTTKQPLFDYSLSVSGVTAVTMNGVQGGTATFTQVVAKKSSQYFRINSDQILATSKIIVTLVYDGNGYPIIASQKIALARVDILVVNPDILTTGGTDTSADISIQYQIVG